MLHLHGGEGRRIADDLAVLRLALAHEDAALAKVPHAGVCSRRQRQREQVPPQRQRLVGVDFGRAQLIRLLERRERAHAREGDDRGALDGPEGDHAARRLGRWHIGHAELGRGVLGVRVLLRRLLRLLEDLLQFLAHLGIDARPVLAALRDPLHVVGNDLAADEAARLGLRRLLGRRVAAVPVPENERGRSQARERSSIALHVGLKCRFERFEAVLVAVLAVAHDGITNAVPDLEQVDRTLPDAAARDGDPRDRGARVLEQPSLEPVRLRGHGVDSAAARDHAVVLRALGIVSPREPIDLVVALAPAGGRERGREEHAPRALHGPKALAEHDGGDVGVVFEKVVVLRQGLVVTHRCPRHRSRPRCPSSPSR